MEPPISLSARGNDGLNRAEKRRGQRPQTGNEDESGGQDRHESGTNPVYGFERIERAYNEFCEERFPLPLEEQVTDIERRIGVALPNDYREFLLRYNGGFFTEPDIVPVVEGCPLDRLTFLHGIGAVHTCAELADDVALFDDNDPAQILPIGYTLMGNLLYLATHPEDHGWIGLKKAYSDECFFLADGIEEFFGLLREPPRD